MLRKTSFKDEEKKKPYSVFKSLYTDDHRVKLTCIFSYMYSDTLMCLFLSGGMCEKGHD